MRSRLTAAATTAAVVAALALTPAPPALAAPTIPCTSFPDALNIVLASAASGSTISAADFECADDAHHAVGEATLNVPAKQLILDIAGFPVALSRIVLEPGADLTLTNSEATFGPDGEDVDVSGGTEALLSVNNSTGAAGGAGIRTTGATLRLDKMIILAQGASADSVTGGAGAGIGGDGAAGGGTDTRGDDGGTVEIRSSLVMAGGGSSADLPDPEPGAEPREPLTVGDIGGPGAAIGGGGGGAGTTASIGGAGGKVTVSHSLVVAGSGVGPWGDEDPGIGAADIGGGAAGSSQGHADRGGDGADVTLDTATVVGASSGLSTQMYNFGPQVAMGMSQYVHNGHFKASIGGGGGSVPTFNFPGQVQSPAENRARAATGGQQGSLTVSGTTSVTGVVAVKDASIDGTLKLGSGQGEGPFAAYGAQYRSQFKTALLDIFPGGTVSGPGRITGAWNVGGAQNTPVETGGIYNRGSITIPHGSIADSQVNPSDGVIIAGNNFVLAFSSEGLTYPLGNVHVYAPTVAQGNVTLPVPVRKASDGLLFDTWQDASGRTFTDHIQLAQLAPSEHITIDPQNLTISIPTRTVSLTGTWLASAYPHLIIEPRKAVHGAPVTLTVKVEQGATGTVTFYDHRKQFFDRGPKLGTATIVNGKASITVTNVGVGRRQVSAHYSGDAKHHAEVAQARVTIKKATLKKLKFVKPRTAKRGNKLTIKVRASKVLNNRSKAKGKLKVTVGKRVVAKKSVQKVVKQNGKIAIKKTFVSGKKLKVKVTLVS